MQEHAGAVEEPPGHVRRSRGVREDADHDFAITVANTHGRGARAGVVRSALRTLDDRGVTGRIWMGAAYDSLRPAPAHRYGP